MSQARTNRRRGLRARMDPRFAKKKGRSADVLARKRKAQALKQQRIAKGNAKKKASS